MRKVEAFLRAAGRIEKMILGFVFSGLVLVITYQIVVRWMGLRSLRWVEELCQYVYVISVMLGVSIGTSEDALMKVSALQGVLPKRAADILNGFISIFCGGFSIYFARLAYKTGMTMLKIRSKTTVLKMPIGFFYVFIAVCFAGMALRNFVHAMVEILPERADPRLDSENKEESK